MLALGLALLAGANAAVAPDVTFEIDNLSPMISYSPPLQGPQSSSYTEPVWDRNPAKNAWRTSFYNQKYTAFDIKSFSDRHYTWANGPTTRRAWTLRPPRFSSSARRSRS